jgi:hypothetical protein
VHPSVLAIHLQRLPLINFLDQIKLNCLCPHVFLIGGDWREEEGSLLGTIAKFLEWPVNSLGWASWLLQLSKQFLVQGD